MKFISLSILLLIMLSSSWLFSQEDQEKHPILTDKYQFGIGLFYPSKSIDIGVDGSEPDDGDIEFGKAFGFDGSQATFFFGFDWRFSEKWKLSFEYFGLKNSGSRVLLEDVEWEDLIFKEGTNVNAGIDFNLYRIYVGRSFSRGQKHEFGGGLGVHAMNVKTFIEGDALTSEGSHSFENSRKSITIPLPNLGLWYYYAPTMKWAFTTRLDIFAISIGSFSGVLWDITPGVQYQLFKNVGLALNYRYIKIGAEFDTTDWKGNVDIVFHGPSFTITGNF